MFINNNFNPLSSSCGAINTSTGILDVSGCSYTLSDNTFNNALINNPPNTIIYQEDLSSLSLTFPVKKMISNSNGELTKSYTLTWNFNPLSYITTTPQGGQLSQANKPIDFFRF